ncbi:MAG: translation initiation factor IF-3 [Patescibacteria group bacterium]|nr:translation initiation factor IF-3 [Patescibacteria group bacterium]
MPKDAIINYQIKAEKIQLVDNEGKMLGVFSFQDAAQKARSLGLDLVQITDKTDPPVCKIIDFGKYLYQQSKKEKKQKPARAGEVKGIRLSLGISEHDLHTGAEKAEKFLKSGFKVRVEMRLRGREKAMAEFSKQKIRHFLEIIQAQTPVKIERELKMEPRGLSMIIAKNT